MHSLRSCNCHLQSSWVCHTHIFGSTYHYPSCQKHRIFSGIQRPCKIKHCRVRIASPHGLYKSTDIVIMFLTGLSYLQLFFGCIPQSVVYQYEIYRHFRQGKSNCSSRAFKAILASPSHISAKKFSASSSISISILPRPRSLSVKAFLIIFLLRHCQGVLA